jgi:hypothetical protein
MGMPENDFWRYRIMRFFEHTNIYLFSSYSMMESLELRKESGDEAFLSLHVHHPFLGQLSLGQVS